MSRFWVTNLEARLLRSFPLPPLLLPGYHQIEPSKLSTSYKLYFQLSNWFVASDLATDVVVHVGEVKFFLHKVLYCTGTELTAQGDGISKKKFDVIRFLDEDRYNIHFGVGCDYCGATRRNQNRARGEFRTGPGLLNETDSALDDTDRARAFQIEFGLDRVRAFPPPIQVEQGPVMLFKVLNRLWFC
ncbi:hypothetical protein FCM35_KLT13961 [Carex littledalei]|uniref:Uncharacterized protein n=1 Tax=Carex littledalei TaxID=544730 RepID=A0A833Q9C4_9POAL|nr:hypothetical protein FCM35_KLT13961 [Carex littledalei]